MGCTICGDEKKLVTRDPMITLGTEKINTIKLLLDRHDYKLQSHPTDFKIRYHTINDEWTIIFDLSDKYSAVMSYRYPVTDFIIREDNRLVIRAQIILRKSGEIESSFYHSRWNDELNDEYLYELVIHCIISCCQTKPAPQEAIDMWLLRAERIGSHYREYLRESGKRGYTDIQGVRKVITPNGRGYIKAIRQ